MFLPTIPTTAPDTYASALAAAADVIAEPPPGARPIGIHLEGPFLSPKRPGAHRPEWLRPPDCALASAFCDAGPIALMTLAPELDGAGELIDLLRRRGVVVSAGHSDATAAEAYAAFDAGVTMVTHLWNAQRQITSREPGLAGVALARVPGCSSGSSPISCTSRRRPWRCRWLPPPIGRSWSLTPLPRRDSLMAPTDPTDER